MLYLVFIVSAALGSVRGACTHSAMQRARNCTAKFGFGPQGWGSTSWLTSQGDTDEVAHACRNGDLFTAVNCVEKVMEECKNDNTDAAYYFRKMVDIEKNRRAIRYFCTNIRVYTANAKCIAQHHEDQDQCAKEASSNYNTQASATKNMDVLMRFQCTFFNTVVDCSEKVFSEKCSSEAGDLMKTVLLGFEAPVCTAGGVKAERSGIYDVHSDNSNRSQGSSSSVWINIFMFIIIILISLRLT